MVVFAQEIIEKINDGKDVYFEDVLIEGELDFTSIKNTMIFKHGENDEYTLKTSYVETSLKFIRCTFRGNVIGQREDPKNVNHVVFLKDITFFDSIFEKDALLKSQFMANTNFEKSCFKGLVNFECAQFIDISNFEETQFRGTVNFGLAQFLTHVIFHQTQFFGPSIFGKTKNSGCVMFDGKADFAGAVFHDKPNFHGVLFHDANFKEAVLQGKEFNPLLKN